MMVTENIFDSIPDRLDSELLDILVQGEGVKIERIVSKGHTSPESGWYEQSHDEWVIVLKGEAIITFENGEEVKLTNGSYFNLPPHTKHKVSWTRPDEETIWLVVHY